MSVTDRHAPRAAGSVFRSRTMLALWLTLVAACIWTMR